MARSLEITLSELTRAGWHGYSHFDRLSITQRWLRKHRVHCGWVNHNPGGNPNKPDLTVRPAEGITWHLFFLDDSRHEEPRPGGVMIRSAADMKSFILSINKFLTA